MLQLRPQATAADEGSPSKQFRGDRETKKDGFSSPYGSGGDGSLAGLNNIRPLLTRSLTVWVLTILFLLTYIIPSKVRAVIEHTMNHSPHRLQGAAVQMDGMDDATKICDAMSLKQQNVSARVSVVAGSYSISHGRIDPPRGSSMASSSRSRSLRALHSVVGGADLSKVTQLLDTYRTGHSASYVGGIQDKNLCKRKFVIGTYSCPSQVGERMHEFLNAYAGAVITNRTLIWRYCQRKACAVAGNEEATCGSMLHRLPWIPDSQSIFDRLEKGGCPIDQRRLNETSIVPLAHHAISSERLLACCHVDSVSNRVIDFGVLERRDLVALALPGAKLSSDRAMRASMLFSAGETAAYGALLRSAFDFSPATLAHNDFMATDLRYKDRPVYSQASIAQEELTRQSAAAEAHHKNKKKKKKGGGHEDRRLGGEGNSTSRAVGGGGSGRGGSGGGGDEGGPSMVANKVPTASSSRKPSSPPSNRNSTSSKMAPKRNATAAASPASGSLDGAAAEGPAVASTPAPSKSPAPSRPPRDPLPALSGDEFILAVHVRHTRHEDSGAEDVRGEMSCVMRTLVGYGVLQKDTQLNAVNARPLRPCVALIASDRAATIDRLSKAILSLGCSVRVADHEVTAPPKAKKAPTNKDREKEKALEARGPWRDSMSAVADLELLSHADAFIGSDLDLEEPAGSTVSGSSGSRRHLGGQSWADNSSHPLRGRRLVDSNSSASSYLPGVRYASTFSMLVASLVATNGRPSVAWKGEALEPSSPIGRQWVGSEDPHRVRFLPSCGPSFGSYLPPHSSARKPDPAWVVGGGWAEAGVADGAAMQLNGHYAPSTCPFFFWQCDSFNVTRLSPSCSKR